MLDPDGHPFVAATLDLVMSPFDKVRARLLPQARGSVLEIGVGTGLNLRHYDGIERFTGIEPDPHMRRRAAPRLDLLNAPAELVDAFAEELPFEDAAFDTVVATWVLCTIPDPVGAVREMRRVIKPDGMLILAEHTRAPCDLTYGVQRALNPAWRRLAGGCNLHRDSVGMLREAGFELELREPRRPCLSLVPTYRGTGRLA